jgi:hypothetical protein
LHVAAWRTRSPGRGRWSGVGGFRIGALPAIPSLRSICLLSEAAILTGETAERRQEVGQVLGGAIPDDRIIGIEVSVGQDIPEASDGPPGDLRLPSRYFGRQLLDRFTDDLEPTTTASTRRGSAQKPAKSKPAR